MKLLAHLSFLCLLLSSVMHPLAHAAEPSPLVIMVGVDGLRPNSITQSLTPNIHALAGKGVRAKSLTPAMPSKTFVNFYTLATGLHPENHGMISNAPYDRAMGRKFKNGKDSRSPDWWQGEPIWISAEKQGLKAATYFWVGSEAPIDNIQPTFWKAYDQDKAYGERIKEVLSWLALPETDRPNLVTLYFSAVDSASHDHGLNSRQERKALKKVDRHIGKLLKGLERLALLQEANIVIVSDHGMVDLSDDRVINLDKWVRLNDFIIPDWSQSRGPAYTPFLSLFGSAKEIDRIYTVLKDKHDHMRVLRRHDFDEQYHFNHPTRAPDLMILADPGWTLYTSEDNTDPLSLKKAGKAIATHGYDNQAPSMRASFVAHGPAFAKKLVVEPFDNVEVYGLLACALGIKPAKTNGDIQNVKHIMNRQCR